ncbi:MAG: glycosyltransferase family 1 protein [Verrucomicrobia bacterium]|nr:glycosyltransferase family 1 protein [Verrucomicrobiota bacterium]
MKRFAAFSTPLLGGMHMVTRSLRKGLAPHGIEVRWVCPAPVPEQSLHDPVYAEDLSWGDVVPTDGADDASRGRCLTRYIEQNYDGVFAHVFGGPIEMNTCRYLPEKILRIMVVHLNSLATYEFAAHIRNYVHCTSCVSPRIRDDLVSKYGFAPDRTVSIPNSIDVSAYGNGPRTRRDGVLRLISLGRIEDTQKGVFWLEDLLRGIGPGKATLTVAGYGPALPELRRRLAPWGHAVTFRGRVEPPDVPALLAEHDVFIFPSRYEGFGITLIEAMAAGCVPVSSRIRGVTDTIIEHGKTGFLFPVGEMGDAVSAVRKLDSDRDLLCRMANEARERSRDRFSTEKVSDQYAESVMHVLVNRPTIAKPLPLEEWKLPSRFGARMRGLIPVWIKSILRRRLENAASMRI